MSFKRLTEETHKWVLQFEPLIFALLIALSAASFWVSPYFLSLDGPAHVYNAWASGVLLSGSVPIILDAYAWNTIPVPNALGHVLLLLLQYIFEPPVAEKMLVSLLVFGYAFSFRYMLKTFGVQPSISSWFVLPFIFCFFLYLGFFNFMLSFPIFFYTAGYLRKWLGNLNVRRMCWLIALLLICYFSHLFNLLILLIYAGLLSITMVWKHHKTDLKSAVVALAKIAWPLLIAAMPAIFLVLWYLSASPFGEARYLPAKELTADLWSQRHLMVFNKSTEKGRVYVVAIALLIMLLVGAYHRLSKRTNRPDSNYSNVWLFIAVLLLAITYIMPDSAGEAGYFSLRLIYTLSLALLAWGCIASSQWRYQLPLAIAVMISHFSLVSYYIEATAKHQPMIEECVESGNHVGRGHAIMTLNFSSMWITGHFSHYAARRGEALALHNYEPTQGFFPLVLNHESRPHFIIPSHSLSSCFWWPANVDNPDYPIEHVQLLGWNEMPDSDCTGLLMENLDAHYTLVYDGAFCRLYTIIGTN